MKMIKKDEGFRSTPTNEGIGTHDGEFTGFI